jgi:hypothetical protein
MAELEGPPGAEGMDFTLYRQGAGRSYGKLTITLSAVCLIVGGLVRGVWDVAEYSHERDEFRSRIINLETNQKVLSAALDTAKHELNQDTDKIQDARARMVALETSLGQTNTLAQKLSEDNARLQERVIFLMAQVEGRLAATGQGRKQ